MFCTLFPLATFLTSYKIMFLTLICPLRRSHHAETPHSTTSQELSVYWMASYTTGACWWQAAGQPDHMQPLSWEGLRSESLSIHLLSLTNQWLLFLCQTRLTLPSLLLFYWEGGREKEKDGADRKVKQLLKPYFLSKANWREVDGERTQRTTAHLHQYPHQLLHLQPTTAKASAMARAVPFKISFRLLPDTISLHRWCLYVIVSRTKLLLKTLQAVNLGILASCSLLLISLNLMKAIACNTKTWRYKKAGKQS